MSTATPQRFKDRYWVKAVKWHAYKRFTATPKWRTRFLFDRAVRGLGPGDVVLDCGANLGDFTELFLSTGATVHAFEPDPWTFERLRGRFNESGRLHLYQHAVSVEAGEVSLYRRTDFSESPEFASEGASLYSEKCNVDPESSVSVEQVSLVDFIRGLGCRLSLLKMDIEGAEVDVLEHLIADGCLHLCDRVFVETHEDRIPSLRERTERLRDLSRGDLRGRLFLDWR
jgi:FkbM family methyltransferase